MEQERRLDELLEVLERFSNKRTFVAVLGSPDPDGLSSAWALSFIARQVQVQMDILTFEVISRPDNIVFARLLGIPFRHIRNRLPKVQYEGYAVVDRQNVRLPVATPKPIPLLAHFDHHTLARSKALFRHQDPDAGSTATILTGYLAPFLKNDESSDELQRIATALTLGIRTDTNDFVRAGPKDFEAAAILAPFVSQDMVATVVDTPLGLTFIKTLGHAANTLVTKDSLFVAYAGKVPRNARDSIGQTADFLLRVEGARTVVVFGIVGDFVVGSLRTRDPGLDICTFLETALRPRFGPASDCGGRRFSGGFQIPVALCPDLEALPKTVTEAFLEAWEKQSGSKGRRVSKKKTSAG